MTTNDTKPLTADDAETLLRDTTPGPWSAVYPVTDISRAPRVVTARGDLVFQLAPIRVPLAPLPDLRLVAAAPDLAASVAHWHERAKAVERERDEARPEADRLRAELDDASARFAALALAVESSVHSDECPAREHGVAECDVCGADGGPCTSTECECWIATTRHLRTAPRDAILARIDAVLSHARRRVEAMASERNAAAARAARAEAERDELSVALRNERETLRWAAQQAGLGEVPHEDALERVISAKADACAEVERLRAIVAGRTTPPTEEEINAHAALGGSWLITEEERHGSGQWSTFWEDCPEHLMRHARSRVAADRVRRWVPVLHGPCAWPVAGGDT